MLAPVDYSMSGTSPLTKSVFGGPYSPQRRIGLTAPGDDAGMLCRQSPGGAYGAILALLVGGSKGWEQLAILTAIERDHDDQPGIFLATGIGHLAPLAQNLSHCSGLKAANR